jgi:hypothetical protein
MFLLSRVTPAAACALALAVAAPVSAQLIASAPGDTIGVVLLHPVVSQHFVCLDHPEGQLRYVGDALGADCVIIDPGAGPAGRWPAFYRNAGRRNEDWYGWNQRVLAPFDGVVDSVHINTLSNAPGVLGRSRASGIVFRRADGVRVLYAHVQAITVAAGDSVRAGQHVARVGNNGPSVVPHTHVGAWRNNEPLQIRFDLRAMAKLSRRLEVIDDSTRHVVPAP